MGLLREPLVQNARLPELLAAKIPGVRVAYMHEQGGVAFGATGHRLETHLLLLLLLRDCRCYVRSRSVTGKTRRIDQWGAGGGGV